MSGERRVPPYASPPALTREGSTQESCLSSSSNVGQQMPNIVGPSYGASFDGVQQWPPGLNQPVDTGWFDASAMIDASMASSLYEANMIKQPVFGDPPGNLTQWDMMSLSSSLPTQMPNTIDPISSVCESPATSPREFGFTGRDSWERKQEKRREQNRTAQRAYRSRKEEHTVKLQKELEELREKHRGLQLENKALMEKIVQMKGGTM